MPSPHRLALGGTKLSPGSWHLLSALSCHQHRSRPTRDISVGQINFFTQKLILLIFLLVPAMGASPTLAYSPLMQIPISPSFSHQGWELSLNADRQKAHRSCSVLFMVDGDLICTARGTDGAVHLVSKQLQAGWVNFTSRGPLVTTKGAEVPAVLQVSAAETDCRVMQMSPRSHLALGSFTRVEKNTHGAAQPTCLRHISKDGAGWASGASRLAVDSRCFRWLKGARGVF